MNHNPFIDIYKTWPDDELLDVLNTPADYQPMAVEAAQIEIEKRQLTSEQLTFAKARQAERQNNIAIEKQKVERVENKIKSASRFVFNIFNPIQKDKVTTDNYILTLCVFMFFLSLYQVIKDFGLLRYMFEPGSKAKWDFSVVLMLMPYIFLPISASLFWLRKKNGWILTTCWCTYSATGAFFLFLDALKYRPIGIPSLDKIFPAMLPEKYLLLIILYGVILWIICKQPIKEIYKIDERTMRLSIIISAVLTIATFVGIIY